MFTSLQCYVEKEPNVNGKKWRMSASTVSAALRLSFAGVILLLGQSIDGVDRDIISISASGRCYSGTVRTH